MSKYTAEQVEVLLGRDWSTAAIRKALHEYAAFLRERESAKAAVTDAIREQAMLAWTGYWCDCNDANVAGNNSSAMRAALEAVASMLARAADGMVSVTKQDANDYCRILSLLGMEEEGDPVEWVQQMLTSARVPDAEVTALKNLAYDMRQQAGNNNRLTHIGWAQRVERVVAMLAAAPKPEKE